MLYIHQLICKENSTLLTTFEDILFLGKETCLQIPNNEEGFTQSKDHPQPSTLANNSLYASTMCITKVTRKDRGGKAISVSCIDRLEPAREKRFDSVHEAKVMAEQAVGSIHKKALHQSIAAGTSEASGTTNNGYLIGDIRNGQDFALQLDSALVVAIIVGDERNLDEIEAIHLEGTVDCVSAHIAQLLRAPVPPCCYIEGKELSMAKGPREGSVEGLEQIVVDIHIAYNHLHIVLQPALSESGWSSCVGAGCFACARR